jgi:hypothetical protein
MKRPDGVVVIAVYYALVALVFLVGACATLIGLVAVLATVFDRMAATWAVFGIGLGLLFCLIFLAGSVMAAWGLLTLKNWGRWAAIVLAVLQLPAFPIWTVIGGLIIYYLLREDVRLAFDGGPTPVAPIAPAPPAPPVETALDAGLPVWEPPTPPAETPADEPTPPPPQI